MYKVLRKREAFLLSAGFEFKSSNHTKCTKVKYHFQGIVWHFVKHAYLLFAGS